jgi:hypothetical protein
MSSHAILLCHPKRRAWILKPTGRSIPTLQHFNSWHSYSARKLFTEPRFALTRDSAREIENFSHEISGGTASSSPTAQFSFTNVRSLRRLRL